jgi:hypothetical protein
LNVLDCRFNDNRDSGIKTQNIACVVVVRLCFFGEKNYFGSASFISIGVSTSVVTVSFCCFQTSGHEIKKAVTTDGDLTLGAENWFSHKSVGQAVSGKTVDEVCECGMNHDHCDYWQ